MMSVFDPMMKVYNSHNPYMEHEALDVLTQNHFSSKKEALEATANQHDQHTSHKKKAVKNQSGHLYTKQRW